MDKLKICDGCGKPRRIWKNLTEDGVRKRLCKECWSCHSSHSSKPIKQHKPLAPRSTKRTHEEKIYAGKRVIFMHQHSMCEANISGLCTHKSTDVHHKAGRIGSLLVDETQWMAVCRACHMWIETHPIEATEKGWRSSKTI
jgi:uncharacterized CHY-type Zn-finger protein